MWPAFYTDVTDAYRLNRRGRIRTDLGGVYFNAAYAVVVFIVYLLTGAEYLLVVVVIGQTQIIQQLLPFPRLDGHYLLSDIAGVGDLSSWMRPVLRRFVRQRGGPDPAAALRPAARRLIVGWVVTSAVLLPVCLVLFLRQLPRVIGTLVGAVGTQGALFRKAVTDGDVGLGVLALFGVLVLTIPFVGMAVILLRLARRGRALIRSRVTNPAEHPPVLDPPTLIPAPSALSYAPDTLAAAFEREHQRSVAFYQDLLHRMETVEGCSESSEGSNHHLARV